MRIVWWADRFWPFVGGIETLGLAVIPRLQALGHEVIVVTSHSSAVRNGSGDHLPDTDCHQSIPIRRFHFNTALHNQDLKQLLQTRRELTQFKQRFKPDVTHIHFSGASPLFHWLTGGGRTLLTLHSLPRGGGGALVEKSVQAADHVTGVSAHILRQVAADRSSVIYNGVVPPNVVPQPLPKAPVFLCIGRFVAWKRFDWAIDRFADLLTTHPAARLVMVGDGTARAALEAQVERLDLQARISFTGMLSKTELYDHINRSTALLVPSAAMENIPYTAIEASWFGRPVIASNVSGLPEIIVNEETGFLVEPTDQATWLRHMTTLAENRDVAQRMGVQASRHVQRRFSLSHCISMYDSFYQRIAMENQIA